MLPTSPLNVGAITGIVVGRTDVTLLARVVGYLGTPITPADVAAISWQVSDLTAGTVLGTGTFAVASVVFGGLVQTDPRWTRDSQQAPGPDKQWGYNFLAVVPASAFAGPALVPLANAYPPDQLQADVTMTPASGNPFRLPPFLWKPIASYP